MARKGLTGQLSMFDLLKSIEDVSIGEVQMVSLMPDELEDELEVEDIQVEEVQTEEIQIEEVRREEPQENIETRLDRRKTSTKKEKNVQGTNEKPAMCRSYIVDGEQIEIAYINYNKVRITYEGKEPELYVFESSKEAVDYYVERMQALEPEEK